MLVYCIYRFLIPCNLPNTTPIKTINEYILTFIILTLIKQKLVVITLSINLLLMIKRSIICQSSISPVLIFSFISCI